MHNGTVLMLEGDQTHSGHFEIPSTSRHGDVPVSGNSYNRLHFSSDPNRPESTYRRHWRDNHAPNTHSTAFSFAKEDRSRGEHRFDEISYPGSTSITRSTASGSTMYSYNGVNVAAPFPEKALPPAPTGVAPIFQSFLPPFDPLQPSGPSWPAYAEWGLQGSPPNPIVQYPNLGISLNPHGTGSVISALNPATISNTNQRQEHTYQPGPFLHPGSGASSYDTAVQNTVAVSVPVLVTPPVSKPSGPRRETSRTAKFQCRWTGHWQPCEARITGDRRSLMIHLKEEHNFTCDCEEVDCLWGDCRSCMQSRNIPRHIVSCHLGVKAPCPHCGVPLSRQDANKKHERACAAIKSSAGVVVASVEGYGGF